MTSAGGLVPLADAAAHPARLLLSGPAGGVRAAAAVAAACGYPDAVAFDMGGTSTDVCLVQGGVPEPTADPHGGGIPGPAARRSPSTPSAPAADRSRASTPAARSSSGPRARAPIPGPACYGRGGTAPTVTDADLVLGRIPAGDRAARARSARRRRRARARSTRAGVDRRRRGRGRRRGDGASGARGHGRAGRRPARSRAGRVRRCGAAARVRDRRRARDARGDRAAAGRGVLRGRAAGSPEQRELVRSWPDPGARATDWTAARRRARGAARRRSVPRRRRRPAGSTAGTRARATSSRSAIVDDFPAEHERRNGFVRPGAPVEVVALRARVDASPRRSRSATSRRRPRAPCVGPAVVAEPDCTVWIPDGWRADARPRPGALGGASAREPGGAADPRFAAGRRSPTRWARCCAAPRSAPTSRSGPTARPRCSPRPASCSRRPSTSPCTSARCRRRSRPRSRLGDRRRRPDGAQRPVRRRHPPQRPHAGVAGRARRSCSWAGSRTARTTPTSVAPRPARCRPTRSTIDEEGLRLPPTPLRRRRRRARSSAALAHARRTARRPRRAARRQRARGAPVRARSPVRSTDLAVLGEILDYGERRMRAAHRRAARRALARSPTCSTPPARRPEQQSPDAHRRRRSRSTGDDGDVRLHRHRCAAAGQRERGRGGDGERGRVRGARGDRSDAARRTAATMRPVAGGRAVRDRSWPRSRRSRSVRATWR